MSNTTQNSKHHDYFDQMDFLYARKKLSLSLPDHLKLELNQDQEGGLIFDSHNGSLYTLSPIAALVLSLLQDKTNPTSLPEIIKEITATYECKNLEAEDDLIEFICYLKDLGIEVKSEK